MSASSLDLWRVGESLTGGSPHIRTSVADIATIYQTPSQRFSAARAICDAHNSALAAHVKALKAKYDELEALCNDDEARGRGSFWVPYYRSFQRFISDLLSTLPDAP